MPEPGPPSETSVLLRAWQETGDVEALDRLLREEVETLKRRMRSRIGQDLAGSAGISDLAQEAVLNLLRVGSPPAFDNPRAFRAYLFKAAWRLLTARLGSRARRPVRSLPTGSALQNDVAAASAGTTPLEARERDHSVEVALNLLPEEDRDLLFLVYFEDREISVAAQQLGLTRDAANMRLVRARRRLAEKLKGWRELIDS
jgi:RNA polymerase sigma factor (sigma-70 family)